MQHFCTINYLLLREYLEATFEVCQSDYLCTKSMEGKNIGFCEMDEIFS